MEIYLIFPELWDEEEFSSFCHETLRENRLFVQIGNEAIEVFEKD